MRGTLVTLVMCEQSVTRHTANARAGPITGRRSTPLIQGTIPKPDVLTSEPVLLEPSKGTLTLKAYAPGLLLAEAAFGGISLFDDDVAELRDRALALSRQRLTEEGGLDVERWSEEYAVYVVSQYDGPPEELVDRERMAALLKSERLPLDPAEVDYTLSVRFKYARHDLVVVDWDGALVFDPEGDVAWAISSSSSATSSSCATGFSTGSWTFGSGAWPNWWTRPARRCRRSSRRRRSDARSGN